MLSLKVLFIFAIISLTFATVDVETTTVGSNSNELTDVTETIKALEDLVDVYDDQGSHNEKIVRDKRFFQFHYYNPDSGYYNDSNYRRFYFCGNNRFGESVHTQMYLAFVVMATVYNY